MEHVKLKFELLCKNECPGKDSSDICEHLITLSNYATECESVFETGVRGCVSSWSFLHGLLNNQRDTKKLFMNDINSCDISEILEINKKLNIDIGYEWKNNLLLDLDQHYDIVFIDTWHIYGQLKRELSKFSKICKKYIILHDTTVDEIDGETIRNGWDAETQSRETGIPIEEIKKGLWPAVVEFLESNKDWCLKVRYTHNNGLTILSRV
jgi:hypothetical protein